MKKVLILLLAILLSTTLLAQEETLVGEKFHSGGYGGPVSKLGLVNGKIGVFSGGRGGWIINHNWFRLGLGASYMLALGAELGEITSSDISGPSCLIIFKFGSF